MELDANGTIVANPTAEDVARAVDAKPYPEDWYIYIERADGFYVDVSAAENGLFSVDCAENGRRLSATAPLDAARLKTMLIRYLNGDKEWRSDCEWQAEGQKPRAGRDGSAPPPWAMIVIVGLVITFTLAITVLPRRYSGYSMVLFGAMAVLILVVIVASKLLEARRAAAWPQTGGRITKSTVEARHHQFSGEETKVTNVPAVAYEFSVGGQKYLGTRIGIGDDSGGANTEETLRHYHVGAAVMVHYDPADPANCVLEREVPKDLAKGCAVLAAIVAAIGAGGYYLFTGGAHFADAYLGNGRGGVTLFAAAFGLVALLMFFATRRQSKAAMGWLATPGKIVTSGTESYRKFIDRRSVTFYAPAVEFTYRVNDLEYHSWQITLGVQISGSQAYAEKIAARYPQGNGVEVHYDPDNPANAALENPLSSAWPVLAVALFCFAVAVYASGILGD